MTNYIPLNKKEPPWKSKIALKRFEFSFIYTARSETN
nr:MAG TPA: hypothetical protein [Caudoviricetes sp.]